MEDNNMGDLRQAIHDEAKWTEFKARVNEKLC